jgi:hypothetical protein
MFPKNEFYTFTGSRLHVISTNKDVLHIPNTNQIYLGKFIQMGSLSHNGKIIQNGVADFQYGSIRFPHYSEIKISSTPVRIWENNIEPVFTYESLYGH